MEIKGADVRLYEKVTLINAMLDPGEVIITTEQIGNRI